MKGMTIIVRKVTQFIAPIIFLFGIYIVFYGHLTPGGGFAGGVIMASAFILQILANGEILDKLRKEESGLEFLESGAILGFIIIAGFGLILSSSFVFFSNFINKGVIGKLLSAGMIPLENIIVGTEVCAAITTIFIALVVYKDEVAL
ncbi:MAG: MnhB domain-containing protein [Candidatus Stygibacter australis]|nr:MnhB domain-containing protein [Candidatus Stygibacter australis]